MKIHKLHRKALLFLALVVSSCCLISCGNGDAKTSTKKSKTAQSQKAKTKKKSTKVAKKKSLDFSKIQRIKTSPKCQITKINGKKTKGVKKIRSKAGSPIAISGWAVDIANKSLASDVYVLLGKRKYKASYGKSRANAASYLKDQKYLKSGYTVTIKDKKLEKGVHPMTLRIVSKDGKGYYVYNQNIEVEVY